MRVLNSISLLLAAAGTQVTAQSTTTATSAAPSSTVIAGGPETGKLGNATIVSNNPEGVVYKAVLPAAAWFKPSYPDGGNIQGEITAVAAPGGKGVTFTVKLSNLPKEGGPLPYHLHVAPVPSSGNCTQTLAHLDPWQRGQTPACNKALPETCEVGDLSGKHEGIPTGGDGTYENTYTEYYASTLEGLGAFFGNRSIVFHYPNSTRITCANFTKVEGGASSSVTLLPSVTVPGGNSSFTIAPTGGVVTSTTAGGGSGSSPSATGTGAPLPGAASGVRVGAAGALVFGAAVMFML
ncbi:superoxide dismutase [Podospora australis]|uniref:superoxide dismutase n=1 Tax=Podospora australis TaxID=1536484 RepID=A0AAN6WQ87_9PEZI|nr:superoxide dismutase [Podospora australis]